MWDPVIAWPRGSVPEVIEDGVTGFIVETEADAVAAIGRARRLDRGRIRETFERRFSARRMAEAYFKSYQTLLESPRSSRLLKKGRLPLTLNCESDSYANKGMAGGIDARFGYADG